MIVSLVVSPYGDDLIEDESNKVYQFLIDEFSRYYNVDYGDSLDYVNRNERGKDALCRFAFKKYNITMCSYRLDYDSDHIFSHGFEIEDDEALTALMLKIPNRQEDNEYA